jgi:hypothetical protein
MRERVYCSECGIQMEIHPVTTDYTLTQADLMSEEDLLSGILDEFYSCPECGKTAVPNEEMYAQQAMNTYAWHQVVAM